MALSAPIGGRPIVQPVIRRVRVTGQAKPERENDAVAVEQRQPSQRPMPVAGVDSHETIRRLQARTLAAECEQVRVIKERIKWRSFLHPPKAPVLAAIDGGLALVGEQIDYP